MTAPVPDDETERLAALHQHQILDTPPEQEFDDLIHLAAHICGTPIAAVSLIDADRQWFKAILGLDVQETSRDAAFCAHTILQDNVLIISDAQVDPRFADNPLVTGDPNIRFYAGATLTTDSGYALGSLCVIDRVPRQLTPEQQAALRVLARQVSNQMELARRIRLQEQLMAERAAAEAERRCLAAIVEASADAIISTDMDGTILSWNAGAERLYGFAAEEMIGQSQCMLVPQSETSMHSRFLPTLLQHGRIENLEVVRRRKSGERIDVSLTLSLIRDDAGSAVAVSAVGRDITQRKKAERSLEAQHQFQTALLESLQEGIVACDANGILTIFNRAAHEFHGLPEQPLPPEQWAEHFDLYEADGVTPMRAQDVPLLRAFRGESVRDAEMVVAPAYYPARTLLANGRAIYGTDGEQLGAVVAMHDVTERKRFEREVSRLAAIVESSEEAILAATIEGNIIAWNKGAEKLYGYTAAEVIGQNASVLAGHDQQSPVPAAVRHLLRGEAFDTVEVLRIRKDGTQFHAALSFSPIRDAMDQMIGLSCIARDITAQKQAEAALAESNAALQESEVRLRRLTDAAFEGIAVSQDGILIDANTAFAALFGYDAPSEMTGRTGIELAAPESRALVTDKVAACNEEPYEATLLRRDGSTFPAELRGRMIQLEGRLARVTAVRDISERQRLEMAMQASHRTLQESQTRLAEAQRIAKVGSWEYDIATESITWSDELFRLFEMDPADGSPSVESLMARYHPEDVAMHARVTGQAMRDGLPYEFDIRILRPEGSVRWAHAVGRGEHDESGVVRLFGTLMDIHERKLAEERFRVLFEQSSHAHLLCSGGRIIDCNPATLSLMGCSDKAQILPLHPIALSPEFQPDGRRSDEKGFAMEALAFEHGSHRFEWMHCKMGGEEFPVEVTLTPVVLADGPVMLAVLDDLTERKHAEEQIRDHAIVLGFQKIQLEEANAQLEEANAQLEDLAMTDGLTGLRNHRAFQERLAEEVSRAARYGTALSLILLDVDRFKQYNDAYGHPAGDAVLRAVAGLLQGEARDTDLAARYGGEEFVLILPQTDLEGAMIFAERLRMTVERYAWPVYAVTASFGVASLRPADAGGAEMVVRADKALYQSKAGGRNRVMGDIANREDVETAGPDHKPHVKPAAPTGSPDVSAQAQAGRLEAEKSGEAILISDLNGTFLRVNARTCELLGYAASEMAGMNGYDLIHPEDLDRQGWQMDDVTADHLVVTERRIRRKDGTWLQAELRTQRLADGTAECVLREITLDKREKSGLGENRLLQEAGEGFSMLDALVAAVDNKDRYTRRHCEDVAVHALMIARGLGLDAATKDTIAAAALVHDVGKIGVPDDILRKPGTLTDDEFAAIKRHPQMGAAIVSAVPGLQDTLAAVRHHHERWDGDGYPFGLRGVEIPLLARLMAVADAFSAMTTDRPYRKGMNRDKAISILADGAGTQWDPECVRELMRAVKITEENVSAFQAVSGNVI